MVPWNSIQPSPAELDITLTSVSPPLGAMLSRPHPLLVGYFLHAIVAAKAC